MASKNRLVFEKSIIRVNRSERLLYPEWARTVRHPKKLKPDGPAKYDISAVKKWLHDGQKDEGLIEARKIYAHLKKIDMLKNCLDLRDLVKIQKKGIVFFRKHFRGKFYHGWGWDTINGFGWKTMLHERVRGGGHYIPYLCEEENEVMICWCCNDDTLLGDNDPALCFAS